MYIGIDLAKETITVTLLKDPKTLFFYGETLANTEHGFQQLLQRISVFGEPSQCLFVMENTGVYGEKLCYFLHQHHITPQVEPAHYIRRAFRLGEKTDPIDSRMIAEYGFRYPDQLHPWAPPELIVEQVRTLFNNRELLQKEKAAHTNMLKAIQAKGLTALPHQHQAAIDFLTQQARVIEKHIKALIASSPRILQHCTNLTSIPGCGLMYCCNFMIVSEGFQQVDYRSLAAFLGICPRDYQSGTSVYKKPTSSRKGSDRMRKQLYLSALAAIGKEPFRTYYLRKKAEGKPFGIILNNIKNKLLRISCAVILSGQPYDPAYKSVRIIK